MAHGAAWGRMGLGMRPVQTKTQARGTGCYLLRWRWAKNPLALPSKYPIHLLVYLLLIPPA
jgi:hypothetical protein